MGYETACEEEERRGRGGKGGGLYHKYGGHAGHDALMQRDK